MLGVSKVATYNRAGEPKGYFYWLKILSINVSERDQIINRHRSSNDCDLTDICN